MKELYDDTKRLVSALGPDFFVNWSWLTFYPESFFCIMCLHIGEQGRVLKFNPLHFLASMQRLAGGRMCRSMQGAAKNSKGRIERFQGIKVQVGSSAVQYFAMQM